MILHVLSLAFLLHTTRSLCPPAELITPACYCINFSSGSSLFCSDVYSPEEILRPLRSLSDYPRYARAFSIEISNSSLLYVPHDLFKGVVVEKIRFYNTQLMSLSDTEHAFEGLEDHLTELRATGAHYVARWDWHQLVLLTKLDLIDVHQVVMGEIEQPFPYLPNITALGIIEAELNYIVDYAFAELPNLAILNLKKNRLEEVKRNWLPKQAERLAIIDLSDNKLSSLPVDFFLSLPQLTHLDLHNNNILTLPEKVFQWPLKHTSTFLLAGNPLLCDCRLQWIVGSKQPFEFMAKCSLPNFLSGRELKYLALNELYC